MVSRKVLFATGWMFTCAFAAPGSALGGCKAKPSSAVIYRDFPSYAKQLRRQEQLAVLPKTLPTRKAVLATTLGGLDLKHPAGDAKHNAEHGDYRFLMLRTSLSAVPGIKTSANKVGEEFGIRMLEGTDAETNSDPAYRAAVKAAKKYARGYNIALKSWLQAKGLWFETDNRTPTQIASTYYAYASHAPAEGYVPDEKTAIQIAKAVWLRFYGRDDLSEQFKAYEHDSVWYVFGVLPKGSIGGAPYAAICAHNGEILWVTHTQ